jgi:hypothetical protein
LNHSQESCYPDWDGFVMFLPQKQTKEPGRLDTGTVFRLVFSLTPGAVDVGMARRLTRLNSLTGERFYFGSPVFRDPTHCSCRKSRVLCFDSLYCSALLDISAPPSLSLNGFITTVTWDTSFVCCWSRVLKLTRYIPGVQEQTRPAS